MSAEQAITIFVLIIPLTLLILALVVPRFHKSDFAEFIIRRGVYSLVFFFLALASGVMAEIVAGTSLNLKNEMFFYMNILGWSGWVALMILGVGTMFKMPQVWREALVNKRMGGDDE